jgi:DNA polymerase-1
MPRLFLLDGMALVYRAHFAFIQNPIRNSKGTNTSALYGFINTLLTILEKEKPTHLGVAFDTSAPTARHEKFPAYKAQRDAMPEELAAAIPEVKRLCAAFHIPVLELDGYEADDLIGTLSKRAETAGFETYMVTPDKDFAQLVSPSTFIWKPGKKGSEHEVIGLDRLPEIWGVREPGQIIDLLGLMGDTVDNIPGVPGIGPKTAQKLIADYHSVENLLDHLGDLKGKQRENLELHAEQARLSKDLATIDREVPFEVTWGALELSSRDDEAVKSLFNEFEFRTLTKRLFGEAAAAAPAVSLATATATPTLFETFRTIRDVEHTYHLADTPEKRAELFAALKEQSAFCFDIETTALNRFQAKLLGIAFALKAYEAWYLPYNESLLPELKAVFASPAEKIGHNLKYDLSVLRRHGMPVQGPFFDTMLVDSLVCPERRHGMDYLAETLLGYSPVKLADIANPQPAIVDPQSDDLFAHAAQKKASKELDIAAIPLALLAEYAAEDADVTFQLAEKLRPQLAASGQERVYREIEGCLLPVLVDMEMEGIACDPNALAVIGVDLQARIDQLALSIREQAGVSFNLGSPKQLGEVLFDRLGLADKAKKTKTGQYKTDEQTLASLEGRHPIIAEILAWRESTKLKSTYLDALPNHIVEETGRIHTTFHQLVAATGRLASTDPNLQNIPIRSEAGREIRKAFVPRDWNSANPQFVLLSCDYSQIELRVMAALSGDASMIAAFRQGLDIHTATAAKVYGVTELEVTRAMRSTAKMVNFGIIYGISAFGLSQRLGIPRSEAASVIDAYFREYPAVREFMERTVLEAKQSGYVETITGRKRFLPDLASGNQNVRGNAERAAINTPIQGTAADMIKLAMIRVDALLREKSYRSRMLLQVHDELVFDLAEEEKDELVPKILEAMRNALPLPGNVPIEVAAGTGPNWLAAH